jgi:MFS family permease
LFIKGKRNLRLGLLVASSSYILISLEMLIILLFQTKMGYLYSQISLIFTSVLVGMAVGVKLKIKNSKIKIIFLGYLLITSLFFTGYNSKIAEWSIFWFMMAFLSGVIGGAIFAIVNRLYLQKEKNPGYIYAFDLFGGGLGVFLTAGIILPVFGVEKLIWGLMGLIFLLFIRS